jgi:L-asparaginase
MKKILMIATGGTIASSRSKSGLMPTLTTEEILSYLPNLKNVCEITSTQICSLDSTNIRPVHWLKLSETLYQNYDKYDGFVILHGTDTMAYTASALSYLIQHSPKPIVITGSQKPIEKEVTDAKTNLEDSFLYASYENASGVQIVFDGKVILGTRARKTHSKSFNAFSSINYPYLAVIQDGKIISYIQKQYDHPIFYHQLNTSVGLVKMFPGIQSEVLSFYCQHFDGLIIESYGVGGIPNLPEDKFDEIIRSYTKEGKPVIMTTQVQNEGSHMSVYQVGHELKEKDHVLDAYDMNSEAVLSKLMWILSLTKDPDEIKKLFYTPIHEDILYK